MVISAAVEEENSILAAVDDDDLGHDKNQIGPSEKSATN